MKEITHEVVVPLSACQEGQNQVASGRVLVGIRLQAVPVRKSETSGVSTVARSSPISHTNSPGRCNAILRVVGQKGEIANGVEHVLNSLATNPAQIYDPIGSDHSIPINDGAMKPNETASGTRDIQVSIRRLT